MRKGQFTKAIDHELPILSRRQASHKNPLRIFKTTANRLSLVLFLAVPSLLNLQAALLWNWESTDGTNVFSGSLTTDGDYSMTTPGAGLSEFTVLSFDSWFLNGTNLVTSGPFTYNDWQVGAPPPQITNVITWSRSEQQLDADLGLTSSGASSSSANILTFPDQGHPGGAGQAVLSIVNAQKPNYNPAFLINHIREHAPNPFDLTFVTTSTVFTPVPEPEMHVAMAILLTSGVVLWRRAKVRGTPTAAIGESNRFTAPP